jgi:DNA-binding NtrC family response regulator
MNMKRLLIVDDEMAYAKSLAFALKKEYDSITAYSYQEAVRVLEERNVQGAILDVRLDENDTSNKDGLRILELIREKFTEINAFVMTSYKDMGYQEEAKRLGAKYFFEKPIDIIHMRRILREKMP